jgi:SanA protein
MKKIVLLIILLSSIYYTNDFIEIDASSRLYSSIKKIPSKKAVLLLGTAKYIKKGRKNYFYTYRIRAVVALWKAHKVRAVLVSGDNSSKYYDEPTTMAKDLIKAGIPKRYITLDYAGFRTLDSIVRAEKIFGLKDYIIVSQKFHLERALYIAKAKGQKVIGFIAKDIPNTLSAKRMKYREYLARTKAFLDLYVLDTQPKFGGKRVKVNYKK